MADQVTWSYLNDKFEKIKVKVGYEGTGEVKPEVVYACFGTLMTFCPNEARYIRFYFKSKLDDDKTTRYLNILFDLFPFMKKYIIENNEEIIKNKFVTISTKNHYGYIFSTLTGIRYVHEFPYMIEKMLGLKEKNHSNEECFSRAHDRLKEYTIKEQQQEFNSGHSLLLISNSYTNINPKAWTKHFRKKFDPTLLEGGELIKDNKKNNKLIITSIHKTFYTTIVGDENE